MYLLLIKIKRSDMKMRKYLVAISVVSAALLVVLGGVFAHAFAALPEDVSATSSPQPKIGEYLKAQLDQGKENIPVIIMLKSEGEEQKNLFRISAWNKESQAAVTEVIYKNEGTVKRNFWLINGLAATIPSDKIEDVAKDPHVEKIHLDKPNQMCLVNGTVQIKSKTLTVAGYDGTGIKIAIVDTGIDINMSGTGSSHSAFKIKGLKDNPSRIVRSVDWVVDDSDGDNPDDFMFHGTLAAGAAAGHNWAPSYIVFSPAFNVTFTGLDLSGVAPNASIINEKVFNSTTADAPDSAIISGIEDAIVNGADVISLSIAPYVTPDETAPLQRAYDSAAYNMNKIVVVAAGNDGPNNGTIRNIAPNAIIVGAVGQTDQVAYYSGRGPTLENRIKPDISAPGGDYSPPDYMGLDPGGFDFCNDSLWVTHIPMPDGQVEDFIYGPLFDNEEFCTGSVGTSFATPLVSGVAALLLQASKSLNAEEVKAIILNSADDISENNPNSTVYDYGFGRVNATEAMNTALHSGRHVFAENGIKKTGDRAYFSFCANRSDIIKITLVWDRHETGGSFITLNNLDLKLYDSNNSLIASSDSQVDNVERIKIAAPMTGNYTLEIICSYITTSSPESFALASTHAISEAGFFDTGEGTYPSIFGTHNGTITPIHDVFVQKMYTYSCHGTGGHSEYVKIWNKTWDLSANWSGYVGDWHYIEFNDQFTLKANVTYNYTIRTGSYPQIIHKQNYTTLDCSLITCEEFIDANGKKYNDWIPAIRLE